jgi:hypothetical protein
LLLEGEEGRVESVATLGRSESEQFDFGELVDSVETSFFVQGRSLSAVATRHGSQFEGEGRFVGESVVGKGTGDRELGCSRETN